MSAYVAAVAAFDQLAEEGDPDGWAGVDPVSLFTAGGCALYAVALVKANPTWGVVAAGAAVCAASGGEDGDDLRSCSDYLDGLCDCTARHFYAASPGGLLHDVRGEHDPRVVARGATLRPVADRSVLSVLESWHFFGAVEDRDAAALAAHRVGL